MLWILDLLTVFRIHSMIADVNYRGKIHTSIQKHFFFQFVITWETRVRNVHFTKAALEWQKWIVVDLRMNSCFCKTSLLLLLRFTSSYSGISHPNKLFFPMGTSLEVNLFPRLYYITSEQLNKLALAWFSFAEEVKSKRDIHVNSLTTTIVTAFLMAKTFTRIGVMEPTLRAFTSWMYWALEWTKSSE